MRYFPTSRFDVFNDLFEYFLLTSSTSSIFIPQIILMALI